VVEEEEVDGCTTAAARRSHRGHRSLYSAIQSQTYNQWGFLYPSPFVIQIIFFLS